MIRTEPQRWVIEGPVTLDRYVALLEAAAEQGVLPETIDWSEVTEVDSSALSLMFSWQRQALASGHVLQHVKLSENLRALADLYGVDALLRP